MTAVSLLDDLLELGISVTREGDLLRCRGPRGVLTREVRDEIRRHKAKLLAELGSEVALEDAAIVATREPLGAVLIDSPRFGQIWVVISDALFADLVAEEQARMEPRPVLTGEDLRRLRGKSEREIRAALQVIATFPEARLLQ